MVVFIDDETGRTPNSDTCTEKRRVLLELHSDKNKIPHRHRITCVMRVNKDTLIVYKEQGKTIVGHMSLAPSE